MKKTIIIVGGDTGGHLFPGVALAGFMRGRWNIVFFIGDRAIAREILEKEGYEFRIVSGCAFPRLNILGYFRFFFVILKSFVNSWKIISSIKPSAVFSTGGYMSFTPVLSARLRGVPVIVHEQNLRPGLTNLVLGSFSNRVAVSFEGTKNRFLSKKVFLSGNPVRKEIADSAGVTSFKEEDYMRILVFGGSQGSRFLNNLVVDALPFLAGYRERLRFCHLAGKSYSEDVKKAYEKIGFQSEVFPFRRDIWELYGKSDFVIARSGATTVAELILLKKPALLVPFSAASENHQYYNALYLARKGCVIMEEEKSVDGQKLAEIVANFLKNKTLIQKFKLCYNSLSESALNPLQIISSEMEKLIKK